LDAKTTAIGRESQAHFSKLLSVTTRLPERQTLVWPAERECPVRADREIGAPFCRIAMALESNNAPKRKTPEIVLVTVDFAAILCGSLLNFYGTHL